MFMLFLQQMSSILSVGKQTFMVNIRITSRYWLLPELIQNSRGEPQRLNYFTIQQLSFIMQINVYNGISLHE